MFGVCLYLLLAASDSTQTLVQQVSASGRVLEIATPLSERVAPAPEISPGAPPLLSFRLFEGQSHGRRAGLDLVLDDAGH